MTPARLRGTTSAQQAALETSAVQASRLSETPFADTMRTAIQNGASYPETAYTTPPAPTRSAHAAQRKGVVLWVKTTLAARMTSAAMHRARQKTSFETGRMVPMRVMER